MMRIVAAPFLLLLVLLSSEVSPSEIEDDVNEVDFFSHPEKKSWVSFLNLKTTITEKKEKGRLPIPKLRIKATLSKDKEKQELSIDDIATSTVEAEIDEDQQSTTQKSPKAGVGGLRATVLEREGSAVEEYEYEYVDEKEVAKDLELVEEDEYEYYYEDEETTQTPREYKEVIEETEKEEPEMHFIDEIKLQESKSKIVVKEVRKMDTGLFEKELMSMRVRDEEVEQIRQMLVNATHLEESLGMGLNELGGSHILQVLQEIGYDNNTVPLIFSDIPVHVLTQMKILHIGNFDSHLMEYSVDAEMNMRWFDLRLAHNKSRPIRISEKRLIDLVWRPDPYFVNSKHSAFHRVSFPNFRMIVTPQGLVSYTMRVTLLPSCPMIFCRYPHDRQQCDLQMSSIAYPRSLLRFSWHSSPFSLQTSLSLPELHISKIWTDTCDVEGKLIISSCLRLVLSLKREGGRFIVEKYIPSALAMMFGWVAPYVPYHYEEVRIVTPITVLLTLVQMEKGDEQVRTSYLTSIDVWFAVMKVFTVASLVESIIVLALIKRSRAIEKQAERAPNEWERARMEGRRRTMRRCVYQVDRGTRLVSPIVFLLFLLYYVFLLSRGNESDCVSSSFG